MTVEKLIEALSTIDPLALVLYRDGETSDLFDIDLGRCRVLPEGSYYRERHDDEAATGLDAVVIS